MLACDRALSLELGDLSFALMRVVWTQLGMLLSQPSCSLCVFLPNCLSVCLSFPCLPRYAVLTPECSIKYSAHCERFVILEQTYIK